MLIYRITNIKSGKVYIGQTVRTLEERMAEHARHSKTAIDAAIKKYGIDAFNVEVIDTAETVDELNEKERYWIQYYGCEKPNGYNLCEGGGNTRGYNHREASKAKMSIAKKKAYIGDGNPFYGKHHSEGSKAKMSASRKNMAHVSPEKLVNIRESHHKVKVRNVDTGEVFSSIKEAAEKYSIKETHITRVCKGRRNRTGGFRWEYVNT